MAVRFEALSGGTDEVAALLREYTEMLVRESPAVAERLRLQGYGAEAADLGRKYGPPGGRLYLARAEGRPAGCAALRGLDGERCEVKRLYVRPAFRGRGIASGLMERLLADARAIGYRRVFLDTLPFLTGAVRLYRGMGFRETDCYSGTPLPDTIYMELELSDGRG